MGVPDLLQDLVAGAGRPGIAGEEGQEVELLAGEVDLVAVDGGPAGAGVDLDPTGVQPVSYTHLDVYKRQLRAT